MAVARELRGYIDDSGDEPDPQHRVIALACYLSELDRWKVFEREWGEVLGDNHVPYLHMKEWWEDKNSIYGDLKSNRQKQETFFRDLAGVIKRNIRYCTTQVVRLPDLRKFNAEHHLKIGAYSLALYGCVIHLRLETRDEDINLIIDKTTKPYRQIELAKAYAQSDTWDRPPLKSEEISIRPLEKDNSFKEVLPIQAADWMAWEIRKNSAERISWNPGGQITTQVAVYRSYSQWKQKFTAERGREPRDRKSAWALYKATPQSGIIWDYQNILGAHVNRHKNGWRVRGA